MLLPGGRAAGEVLQPRIEVGDPVFDVQDGHGPVLHMAVMLPFALSCQRGLRFPPVLCWDPSERVIPLQPSADMGQDLTSRVCQIWDCMAA